MYLTDRELAMRWWERKTDDEKIKLSKEAKYPRSNFTSFTGNEIEYIWRNQPYNQV